MMTKDDIRSLVESNKSKVGKDEYCSYDREKTLCALLGMEARHWEFNGSYQGEQGSLFVFDDGYVLITCSYYGSCSYCDLWQGIGSDKDAYDAARTEIFNGLLFDGFESAHEYLADLDESDKPHDFKEVLRLFIPYVKENCK